jgi:uncharacterized protein
MAQLKKNSTIIAEKVWIANNPWTRFVGLLGRKNLPDSEALWIKPCNSIHTFFMKFPIDAVFTDKNLVVLQVRSHLKPGLLIKPVWTARYTFEFAAGFTDRHKIAEGDQLYVDP